MKIKRNDLTWRVETDVQASIALLTNAMEWIIALFYILLTAGIWLRLEGSVFVNFRAHIYLAVYVFVLVWIFLKSRKITAAVSDLLWAMTAAICLAVSLTVSLVISTSFLAYAVIFYCLPVFVGVMMCLFLPAEDYWKLIDKFCRIMIYIAAISMIFWVLASILHILPPTGVVRFNWGEKGTYIAGNSYFGIFYEPHWQRINIMGKTIYRNCGIFAEVPMYGFLLCIAYSVCRLKTPLKKWRTILLLITILSTTGTTAILHVLLFEVIWFGLRPAKSRTMQRIKMYLYAGIVVVSAVVMYVLVRSKLGSGSGSVRLDHLRVSIKLFFQHFPLGVGVGNHDAFTRLEVYKQGISIGLPALYGQAGMPGVILTVTPILILLVASFRAKQWGWTAFVIAFVWTVVCTAVHGNSPIFWLIICYAVRGKYFIPPSEPIMR